MSRRCPFAGLVRGAALFLGLFAGLDVATAPIAASHAAAATTTCAALPLIWVDH